MNTDVIDFLGSLPYLVSRVVEVRRILEEFPAEILKRSPILTEAYGEMLFKCPIINCTRFYQGFARKVQRDEHLGQHERAYKCTHEGCDYRELGFPPEAELRRHVELCHSILPEETTFPNVQRVSFSKALNDAIDRDDVQAVRDICSEMSVCPPRQTGFILRAVKRRSISTALVLVELLGTDIEMNHVDSKGRTVLHEAVQVRNDDLFDRILDTEINADVRDHDGLTPFLTALQQGYFHAVRLLMNHAGVDLMPQDKTHIHEIYYKGMKEAAASGVDDILKPLFSNFVSICARFSKEGFRRHINHDLPRVIAKAALNGHISSVKLILELAHALDLESMYEGLLKKELHHGIEAMTTFLMQRYGEAKAEIDKNGKTYGNALANAAIKDDSALVMRLLKEGADIDYADAGLAYNALGAAASRGNMSMVSLLVEQGADINAKGGYSGNALCLACRKKHMAVVDFLLEKGADVNLQSRHQRTVLMECCEEQNYSLAQSLIEAGADVKMRDEYQNTALHRACMASSESANRGGIVDILLQKGADVHQQNQSGETALFLASFRGYKEAVEILVQQGADVNLQNTYGETALFKASRYGYKGIVEILVQGGADVNLQNTSRETALFKASFRGYKGIVEILVQKGADVNLQNVWGQTAFLVAFERGNREIVQVLIKTELDLEVRGSHQRTALLQAAKTGWDDIVRILIEKGADIDSVDADQQTALLIASTQGHAEVVRILLASGARDLDTALCAASVHGHADVFELLLKKASPSQQRSAVQLFLRLEPNVRTPGGAYENLLSSACSFGWQAFVKILLEEADFKIPVQTYDNELSLIGSRGYLLHDEYKAIAKLLREARDNGVAGMRKETFAQRQYAQI